MIITILTVTSEEVPNKNGNGTYTKASVAYKEADGKVNGKTLVSFANKNVFDTLIKSQPNDVFDVVNEKIGQNWNWTSATPTVAGAVSAAPAPTSKGKTFGGSTYATAEERAKTQVYIVRQTSIKHAIEFAVASKTTIKDVEQVIALAKEFEAYVFSSDKAPLEDLGDDIPS